MYIITTTKYSKVDFYFVSDHYDIHLKGLCFYNKNLCYFETNYETTIVSIYKLKILEKIKHRFRKLMFEIFVGYHWSYPQREQGANFGKRKPEWFWSYIVYLYYKTK